MVEIFAFGLSRPERPFCCGEHIRVGLNKRKWHWGFGAEDRIGRLVPQTVPLDNVVGGGGSEMFGNGFVRVMRNSAVDREVVPICVADYLEVVVMVMRG